MNWASVVSGGMSKHARSDVVRASTAATYMDVHTWTFRLWQSATPAHQGLLCLSSPVTLQTEQLHAAHWHLSLSLSRCTGTRRMKLQPWRAFKSGTGPSQLAIVVDYFGLVTTVCTSLHQSAPACTTHAGDSRGPESSSRGPAHMWRLFVDPQSHRLPLVVAVQPALPLLLRILLLSASCTLAGHAASPIASSPARAASTSAPEGGGARPGSHTPTVS